LLFHGLDVRFDARKRSVVIFLAGKVEQFARIGKASGDRIETADDGVQGFFFAA
jgi:hypothetical protein